MTNVDPNNMTVFLQACGPQERRQMWDMEVIRKATMQEGLLPDGRTDQYALVVRLVSVDREKCLHDGYASSQGNGIKPGLGNCIRDGRATAVNPTPPIRAQQWIYSSQLVGNYNYFRFKSVWSGRCLDADYWTRDSRQQTLHLWDCKKVPEQQFSPRP